MEHDEKQLIELLQKRLQKLKILAQEITSAQEACVALDLEALRIHDQQKAQLCAEIGTLDLEISAIVPKHNSSGPLGEMLAAGQSNEAGIDQVMARRLSALFEESKATRAEVQRLNCVYAQFLARSRATLNVMINVISHCLGVYPSLERSASRCVPFERSY